MKLYELPIFNYIVIYTSRDVTFENYTRAQIGLKERFKSDLTDNIFLKLMNKKQ